MSFREIDPPTTGPANKGTGVKATLYRRKTGPVHLRLSLDQRVLDEIEAKANDHYRILVGEGESQGLVKISVAKDGRFAGRKFPRGNGIWFNLGPLAFLPTETKPAAWCQFSITERGEVILVTLPSWVSKGAVPVETPRRALTAVPPSTGGGRDVTAALMGDPPPRRRP